jgi:hypothetical protein
MKEASTTVIKDQMSHLESSISAYEVLCEKFIEKLSSVICSAPTSEVLMDNEKVVGSPLTELINTEVNRLTDTNNKMQNLLERIEL